MQELLTITTRPPEVESSVPPEAQVPFYEMDTPALAELADTLAVLRGNATAVALSLPESARTSALAKIGCAAGSEGAFYEDSPYAASMNNTEPLALKELPVEHRRVAGRYALSAFRGLLQKQQNSL